MTSNTNATFYHSSTELADLGQNRADHDTAAISDRDAALHSRMPVHLRPGTAPKGKEDAVWGWMTFQHTTTERDEREEAKGDLHEGQLHRQNRAAREGAGMGMMGSGMGITHGAARGPGAGRWSSNAGRGGFGGGDMRAGNMGSLGVQLAGPMDALCAGRKPEGGAPPLAKGFPEELDKSMFWNEPIL